MLEVARPRVGERPKTLHDIYDEIARELTVTLEKNRESVFKKYSLKYGLKLTKREYRKSQKRELRKLPSLFG